MKFNEMPLNPILLKAIERLGFTEATAIQSQSIPVALSGSDLMGCAQTGSGKTLAFCVPLFSKLLDNNESCALVMCPTRELAEQVCKVLYDLSKGIPGFNVACLIGGTSMFPQIRNLQKKPRFIVATPGRLNDHLERGTVRLSRFNYLVLDEADRMLDMGFAPQIERVMSYLPSQRQTLLFSATFPDPIRKLAQKYLKNPKDVVTHRPTDHVKTIKQENLRVQPEKKFDALIEELKKRTGSSLIFARTKGRTQKVAWFLKKEGFSATFIHGDRSLRERREAIEGLASGKYKVLVATDVAARGLDISIIEHVINLDLPQVAEDYVHRIGRTGRAGASGNAMSFIAPDEEHLWREIQKVMGVKVSRPEGGPSAPFRKKNNKPFRPSRWKKRDSQKSRDPQKARGPRAYS